MDADAMTRRMVGAVSNPRVDVLGHCTGRLVEGNRGTRPESSFDADVVFAACDAHAPGQLEFQEYGAERAAAHGVPAERIINTQTADDLLAWSAARRS
jgi:putative hydrolase